MTTRVGQPRPARRTARPRPPRTLDRATGRDAAARRRPARPRSAPRRRGARPDRPRPRSPTSTHIGAHLMTHRVPVSRSTTLRKLVDDGTRPHRRGRHARHAGPPARQARARPTVRANAIAHDGVNIADAMFVFDMQNDLPDHPVVNMESGYLDCKLVPDLATIRVFTHRPGYAIVHGRRAHARGRAAPAGAAWRAGAARSSGARRSGVEPFVATELEFYLCTDDWAAGAVAHPVQLAHRRAPHRARAQADPRRPARRRHRGRVVERRVRPWAGRGQHRPRPTR